MMKTQDGMDWIIEKLRKDQSSDGSWDYHFETGFATDAYMIILLRSLEINDEQLIEGLAGRIISKQDKNGSWKLFHDEQGGNLTATVEAYYALLYSGYFEKDDRQLQAAKKYIVKNGGLEHINTFTKVMLALTGQYHWPAFFPIPIEFILLPLSFPLNFYDLSVFGRANIAPILIVGHKKFSLKTKNSPDLSDLMHHRGGDSNWERSPDWKQPFSFIEDGIKQLIGIPEKLHSLAFERAKKYMMDRIEPDGTLNSLFSSTFLMIFALLSLDHKKNDSFIENAVKGLKSMKTEINGFPHMQFTTADVWNTSLISFSLQKAGIPFDEAMIQKANEYVLDHQQDKFGDWIIHNPNSLPGGWGFSNVNTMNPDVDDTTASLRAIAHVIQTRQTNQDAWQRGLSWLVTMQNSDGGWPSFEKNAGHHWISLLPIEKGEYLLSDPSSADLTGRTLEFFGNYTNIPTNDRLMEGSINWLVKHQEKDGSWYGRWGICYLYGTWAAVTGMRAAGVKSSQIAIQNAVRWLLAIQNADGGWGESCLSDQNKKYIPLSKSTLTHTSWAVDALIAAENRPTAEIRKGIRFLLENISKTDWTTDYPKGQGLPGSFYIHYHSYRYVFPLLAFANYQRKFGMD